MSTTTAAPPITIDGDRLRIDFRSFDLPAYNVFLRAKRLPESETLYHPDDETYSITAPARFASLLGVPLPQACAQDLPLSPFLFDDQAAVTTMALAAKRFAIWCACGWGKTPVGLELARHVMHRTGGRFLIVTLNEIVQQWIEMCREFFGDRLPIFRLTSRDHMRVWAKGGLPDAPMLAITNYEKWNPEGLDRQVVSEIKHLAGIALDEADKLRASGGKQKWSLIKSCKGIEYKFLLTATPAPNDLMEFASQASFLEKMRTEQDIIWTFFRRDEKTHRWTVKPHARKAFFEFMSSWSIYIHDPRRYGWRKDMVDVPEPVLLKHEISMTGEQRDWLQRLSADPSGQMQLPGMNDRDTNAIQRNKLSQVAKGFVYVKGSDGVARTQPRRPALGSVRGALPSWEPIASLKPAFVADLIRQDAASGLQVLCWTIFDAESEILSGLLRGTGTSYEVLTGKTKELDRLAILERFRKGETRSLLSRASMLGYGMNLQFVGSMVFSGWSDSFVRWFQAIHRAYRYGQMLALRVHVPVIPELEGDQLDNIFRKQREFKLSIAEMEENYVQARRALPI